jgi:hypothetical protein
MYVCECIFTNSVVLNSEKPKLKPEKERTRETIEGKEVWEDRGYVDMLNLHEDVRVHVEEEK